MKKKRLAISLGIITSLLLFGASMNAYAKEPAGQEEHPGTYFTDEAYDYDNGADVISPILWSTFDVPWDKQTDEENLQYLIASGDSPGYEGLKWWVNSGFDDATKLAYLNTLKATGRISSLWVIHSPLSLEQKSTYFRSHDLRGHGSDVLLWWFENIGDKLTTDQTRKTDAYNYEWYTRSVLNTLEGVEVVQIGEDRYYIAKADLDRNIAAGKITVKTTIWLIDGAPPETAKEVYLYYASSADSLDCKLWNLAE